MDFTLRLNARFDLENVQMVSDDGTCKRRHENAESFARK